MVSASLSLSLSLALSVSLLGVLLDCLGVSLAVLNTTKGA